MKRCSTSYVIRKMQIKTTVRHHDPPTRWAKTKKTDNTKCWQGCGAMSTLIHQWRKCKLVQPLWQFLIKLSILLHYDPAISLLDVYPEKLKTYTHKNLHVDFYHSFTHNYQNLKQPRCASVGKWVNCSAPTVDYYSALKLNYRTMKKHGANLSTYYCLKEASLQKLHIVWLQLCHIL